ncbi:MAG TPA: hypothetical protein VF752_01010 [Thermoleophilaceae bacterium]
MTGVGAAARPVHCGRVLVATRDRGFAQAAAALLARHGYLVESTDRPSRVPEMVGTVRPDVVIVDASGGCFFVPYVLAVVEAADSPAGVLQVGDADEPVARGAFSLWKHGPPERLLAEVERVHAGVLAERGSVLAFS